MITKTKFCNHCQHIVGRTFVDRINNKLFAFPFGCEIDGELKKPYQKCDTGEYKEKENERP